METREGQAGIVAQAAHQQMVAYEQRAFHGAGRDHARLHHRAGNQEKGQRHPKPGEQVRARRAGRDRTQVSWRLASSLALSDRSTRLRGGHGHFDLHIFGRI